VARATRIAFPDAITLRHRIPITNAPASAPRKAAASHTHSISLVPRTILRCLRRGRIKPVDHQQVERVIRSLESLTEPRYV